MRWILGWVLCGLVATAASAGGRYPAGVLREAPRARLPAFHPKMVGIDVAPTGLTLVEVVLPDTPTRVTVTPGLEARRGPGRRFVPVVLAGWDDPVGEGLGLASVPAWYLYRDGELVLTGTRAMREFRDREPLRAEAGTGILTPGL